MKALAELLKLVQKLYGKKALSKTIGTRTNVITLPDKETKRFLTNELNIDAASDAAVKKGFEDAEKLIADIPKMNDQEILTFKNNLQRLDNRLNPPSAEVISIGTKQPVSKEGIKSLTEQAGQMSPPGTLMGNIESRLNQLRASGKKLEDITKGQGMTLDDLLKNPYRSGGPLDPKTGIVRTASREILQKNLKAGKIDIPDEAAKDAILKSYQGGTDPIDVIRQTYGEGILEQLDDIADELNKAKDYKEIQKILQREKLFDVKPKKTYGYDEGVYSDEEMAKIISADSDEGKKITEALIGKPKAKVTELMTAEKIIQDMNKMDPMDAMYEANKVLKKEGKYKNLSGEDVDRIMKETEDHIFQRNIPEGPEDFATGGRVGFQKGTPAIFDQLEMDVPFPHGQRVEMAGGGITALKSLIRFLAAQSGKKGSESLADINPKRLGFLKEMLMKKDKDMLNQNRMDYLESLSDIIKEDKKLLDKIKTFPKDQQESFFKSANEGGNKGRLSVYRDPNFNIDDAIGEIEQMKKNLKFQDVPEEEVKRQMNASGGVAYLMGL